jgi:hypothetical protein
MLEAIERSKTYNASVARDALCLSAGPARSGHLRMVAPLRAEETGYSEVEQFYVEHLRE